MSAALKITPPSKRGTGASRAQLSAVRTSKPLQFGVAPGPIVAPTNRARLRSDDFDPLPGTNPVTVTDHKQGMCRWPVAETPFLFCGAAIDKRSPNYCTHHLEIHLPHADSPATVPNYDLRNLERMITK